MRAMPIAERSSTVPRLRAEMTPVATPPMTHRTTSAWASERVTGSQSVSSGHTSCSVLKEYPKQGAAHCVTSEPLAYVRPATRPTTNLPNWTRIGSSRPIFCRMPSMAAGSDCFPTK